MHNLQFPNHQMKCEIAFAFAFTHPPQYWMTTPLAFSAASTAFCASTSTLFASCFAFLTAASEVAHVAGLLGARIEPS